MIILGLDPGLQKTGWGLIESEGSALRFLDCGLIKSNASFPLPARLAILHAKLCQVFEKWQPETVGVEETFVNKNPASALKLGQARGTLMTVPGLYDVPVSEYAPNKIKKSIVGSGHADKTQMGMMVKTLLPSCGQISEDEADALAVAICHAHYQRSYKLKKRSRLF